MTKDSRAERRALHRCRSVVAEAMFNKVLQRMQEKGSPLDVCVESSSLGPSFTEHDPRVVRLAREAGLQLGPKTQHSFDEVKDPVRFDLILAMDRFDFDEVGPGFKYFWSFHKAQNL